MGSTAPYFFLLQRVFKIEAFNLRLQTVQYKTLKTGTFTLI